MLKSGLGKHGRWASWAVAIGIFGGWEYYSQSRNRENAPRISQEVFSATDRDKWNQSKKALDKVKHGEEK